MKININIELDGTGRDVEVLKAVTRAIGNLPPEGFVNEPPGEPTEVTIHAPPGKVKDALAEVNLGSGAKAVVKETKPEPDPAPETPPAPPEPDEDEEEKKAIAARGQRLRELLLEASKLDNVTIASAKEYALGVAGIKDARQLPACEKAEEVIGALEAVVVNGKLPA